jgi:hypothetical protein
MDIKETFLKLTTRTYPHGTEQDLFNLLPESLETDKHGNLFTIIGGNPSCMFTSHLDTATYANAEVTHVIDGNMIQTDGTSILGADDKAGVTILLWMIENKVPGLYYFFLGEEVGCVGSKKVAEDHRVEKFRNISKVISFDRRGTGSVITHQTNGRCCSDDFAEALSKELNKSGMSYQKDSTGIYTDSAQFTNIYPECTNISVGYYSEHTYSERQDIEHLEKLAKAVLNVDWESLVVKRDPSVYEPKPYSYSRSYYGYHDDWEDYEGGRWSGSSYQTTTGTYKPPVPKTEDFWFNDTSYGSWNKITKDKNTGKIVSVYLNPQRLDNERALILKLLKEMGIVVESMDWDGAKLVVKYATESGGHKTEATREEMAEFLEELNFWKKKNTDYNIRKGELN